MLRSFAVLFVVGAIGVANVSATNKSVDGQYTIVAAQHIRFNAAYHVAVSVHNATEPSTVRITIQNGGDFKEQQEVVVQPWSTETVTFAFGALPPPPSGIKYKLIAEGVQGILFRNETWLHVTAKEFSFLVQSDKALYKPGDLIRFRVLVIDEHTKPVELQNELQVHVEDGASHRLKQWTNQTTTNGVFSGEFRLSDSPVLGNWKVVVKARNETKSRSIQVAEYVLPTFETSIETADNVLFKSGKINANIRGKYTFGKPVHGEAIVTAYAHSQWGEEATKVQKVIKVTTKGAVEFDLVDELKMEEASVRRVEIDVSLEEEFTGRRQNTTKSITVRRNEYIINRNSYNYNYMEGQPFEMELKVMRFDGVPVANEELEVWYSSDLGKPEELHSEKHKLDNEGMVKLLLTFPLKKSGFFVMAKYKDVTEGLGYFPSTPYHKDPLNEFSVSTSSLSKSIGDTVTVDIQSRNALHFFTYQLLARGDVLLTKTVKPDNVTQQNFQFQFDVTHDMLPNVKVVAYTVREDGTTDVSNTYIFLKPSLTNSITLQPAVNETKPGEILDLQITTPPKSFVGLLAIDQSVLLLRSGNDLNDVEVTNTLDEYGNIYARPAFGDYHSYQWRSHQWNPKISSFENVGVFVFSNVKDLIPVPVEDTPHYNQPPSYHNHRHRTSPVAFSIQHAEQASGPSVPTIRKDFPETFIWDTLVVDSADGVQSFHKKVPDTITSWVITAFSLSPDHGLGLTSEASKLTVIKPFFVSLTLPYSVKRGEIVSVPVAVFNYLGSAVNAEVTLFNDDKEFEFVEIGNDIEEVSSTDEKRVKSISIKSNDATGVQFLIKPLKVGSLTIKATAVSPMAGDGIEQILPVTPEGVPQYVNKAVLVDLRDKPCLETKFTIEVPADAVPDSTRIEVSAIADVMGSTIKNLDKLIYMPSGCGEQNMLHFVPNIVIRNYLKAVNQLSDEVELKSRQYMEIGYQRQLTYRHHNGSFSAFGKNDASGSTWLTAFVVRAFAQAAEHITIEDSIIKSALDFLQDVQSENGSFPEVGEVIHRRMQSGAGSGVALTAYTLLAFLENKHSHPEYSNVIANASDFVAKNLDTLDDVYALAVAAYALQLADHPAKADVLRNLEAKAIVDGDRKYWGTPDAPVDPKNPVSFGYVPHTSSVNTEITGYALLAHFHAGPHDQVVPIMKWLLSKRNAQGGFASTQDTIVGLQALATIAGKLGFGDNDVKLSLAYGDAQSSTIEVNNANALVLQQVQLPGSVRDVQVSSSGKGFALLSLAYRYYVNETGAEPRFKVEPKVAKETYPNALHFDVCTSFIPNEDATVSNMAVMEVEFPSGFTFDSDSRNTLAATTGVKKVEVKNGDTLVVLYFNNLGAESVCPKFAAVRSQKVAHQKPAAITVYDYYDTTRKSRVFYNTAETTLCDVCDHDCPKSCSS